MTAQWKSTINNAFTSPRLLHPILEKVIPNLLEDKIQELANLVLFQDNVRPRSTSSQVPVDMKFTSDSLDIRISKKGPWISLLPSSKLNMTPQEEAVDALRKKVMERIALLWSGEEISTDSSRENEFSDRNIFEASTESRRANQRTRSKRTKRNERQRRTGSTHTPSTRISRNKIDCSTHTTNNYYCCVGAHKGLPPDNSEQKHKSPDSTNTQKDFIFDPVSRRQNLRGTHRVKDFSEDSSSNELEDSFSHSFSGKQQRKNRNSDTMELRSSSNKNKPIHSFRKKRQLKSRRNSFKNESENNSNHFFDGKTLIKEANKSESSSTGYFTDTSDISSNHNINESENNSNRFFDGKTLIKEANKSESSSTDYFTDTSDISSNHNIRDITTKHPYFTGNEKTASDEDSDLENLSAPKKLGDFLNNSVEPMPSLRPIPSKAPDPFGEIKKFIETYDTDTKPLGYRRALIELQAELTQGKPDRAKINNLLSLLQADSLQVTEEVPNHEIVKGPNTASTTTNQESTFSQTIQVNPMTIDESIQTDSSVVLTQDQYTNTQLLSDAGEHSLPFMKNAEKLVSDQQINELNTFINDSIEQIDVYMDIVHNDTIKVEVDSETKSFLKDNRSVLINLQSLINSDSPVEKTNTTINSLLDGLDLDTLRLVYDNPELEIPFIEESIDDAPTLIKSTVPQLSPLQVTSSIQRDYPHTDEDIELLEKLHDLLEKVEKVDSTISSLTEENSTANTTTQSDDYITDKEIKLQKKLQTLSKKYENLAGLILKQSKKDQRQQADISELRFQLQHTKNELVEALRRFERLAESTEKKFKISEDQSEYIRNLEGELESLQQILISQFNAKNPRLVSKVMATQTETQEEDPEEENIEETKNTLPLPIIQENDATEDLFALAKKPVRPSTPVQWENDEEEINELLNQYQELGKDLETVKKRDNLLELEKFYNKYANSGIYIQLGALAEQLRFHQDALSPSRDMVLKRRQETMDMLELFDKILSEEIWSDDSQNKIDESAVLLQPNLFEPNDLIIDSKKLEEKNPIFTNIAVADAGNQSEKITTKDSFTQYRKNKMTDRSTQIDPTHLVDASTQAEKVTIESSTQVSNKSDRELELEDQLKETSTKYDKLVAFMEKEFKATEDQFESIKKLETQVQALEEVNEDLVAIINRLKKRNILSPVKEEESETLVTEEKETEMKSTENKETEIDFSAQLEPSRYVFADLPPYIKNSYYLYKTVTHDLNELKYSLTNKKFYEKYKKSTIIADLTTFAKRVNQIDPITDIVLPTEQEISNVVKQVTQLLLEEKKLEKIERAEEEEDFNQRLKEYNELTSDLKKFQNNQLTLSELYNKYTNTDTIRELEIFALQERNHSPSKASVQNKIKTLRALLIRFDNDLETLIA